MTGWWLVAELKPMLYDQSWDLRTGVRHHDAVGEWTEAFFAGDGYLVLRVSLSSSPLIQ